MTIIRIINALAVAALLAGVIALLAGLSSASLFFA